MKLNVLDKGFVELINSMGDDNTIVASARVSYLGESKGPEQDGKLIKYLLENEHMSPFEQVEFQFRVKCPLFVARQWMRHRMWSYNEVSRRYTSEEIDFYIPSHFRKPSNKNKQTSIEGYFETEKELLEDYEKYIWLSQALYEYYLDCGVAKEQARMILPQSLYTKFYAKTDLRNLLHFVELRNSSHAQYEIQIYASAIETIIENIVPVTYSIWKKLKAEKIKER